MSHAQLVGERFDHLLVIELIEVTRANGARWLCACDCGAKVVKETRQLKRGDWVQRCRECSIVMRSAAVRTHGETGSPLYKVWTGIKDRCGNPKHPFFHCYGGKGVRICDAWQSYEGFRAWAVDNGYEYRSSAPRGDRLSIDRINPAGNYDPANCQWITCRENSRRAATKRGPVLRVVGEN